jgi:hypothetical protein
MRKLLGVSLAVGALTIVSGVAVAQWDHGSGHDMHGANGHAMKAGAAKIDIRYTALPDGAQIRYTAKDSKLVTALHQWFSAQLSDHGDHATHH